MADLRIHQADVRLTVSNRLRLHQAALTALPAPSERALRIHDCWLTVGFEEPAGGGGTRVRWQGAWVAARRFVRWQGQWVGPA